MPRHHGGVWSGLLGSPPPQEILVHTDDGGVSRQIFRNPLQGISRCDPGGPAISQNLQCGCICVPPKLGHCGGIGRGGSGTWRGRHRGLQEGCSTSFRILLCGQWNPHFDSGGTPIAGLHNPYITLQPRGTTHKCVQDGDNILSALPHTWGTLYRGLHNQDYRGGKHLTGADPPVGPLSQVQRRTDGGVLCLP